MSTIPNHFPYDSRLMKAAKFLGFKRLRWSLRRLHCPVNSAALVLEVGAGGNPYPRANVLLDAMESTIERMEKSLIKDRPLVLGICEKLPFKDKSFDFVIASHVLEHTSNPEKFLSELMRVGKAGYIETPEGWFEKLCAFTFHRLEVSNLGGKLFIRKKSSWKPDESAILWDNKLAHSKELLNFLSSHADLYHMRFFWKDKIEFEIVNPECNANWPFPIEQSDGSYHNSFFCQIREMYLKIRRWAYSQNTRNREIDILKLLMCPDCASTVLSKHGDSITCDSCKRQYDIKNNIPHLFPSDLDEFISSHQTYSPEI